VSVLLVLDLLLVVVGGGLWLDTFEVLFGGGVAARSPGRQPPGIRLDQGHNLPHARQGMVPQVAYPGGTSSFATGRSTLDHADQFPAQAYP
jgi:hypothetical protein